MSRAESNLGLPQGGAAHAFDNVNQRYAAVTSVEQWQQLGEAERDDMVLDYFDSALDYLQYQSGNPYLDELAMTTIASIAGETGVQRDVNLIVAEDTHAGIDLIDAADPEQVKALTRPIDPFFVVGRGEENKAFFILPFAFVQNARTAPIDTIARLTSRLSVIRDYVNMLPMGGSDVNQRAGASVAEFLNTVIKQNPETELSPEASQVRAKYERGIAGLPLGVAYKGTFQP